MHGGSVRMTASLLRAAANAYHDIMAHLRMRRATLGRSVSPPAVSHGG